MLGASAAAAEASVNSDEPGEEHPLAPEAVSERRAGQQQHRVGEHVGVDGPLQRLNRRAEVAMDRGQRDADDEVVEHHHEQRHRDDAQRPAVSMPIAHLDIPLCLSLSFSVL